MQLKSLAVLHNQLPDAVSFLHGFLKELFLPSLQTLAIAEPLFPAGIDRLLRMGLETGVSSLKSLSLLSRTAVFFASRLRLGFARRFRAEFRDSRRRIPAVMRSGGRGWESGGRFIQRGIGFGSAGRSLRIRSGNTPSPSTFSVFPRFFSPPSRTARWKRGTSGLGGAGFAAVRRSGGAVDQLPRGWVGLAVDFVRGSIVRVLAESL